MQELQVDVAVIGGGVGGVAAALAAARQGRRVLLTEETPWIGGQLTSQGVPPDEHPWIEQFGCTASYRHLRDAVRGHYRTWYPLSEGARADRHLNPGLGAVSRLCHEPRAALAVLEGLLAPHRGADRIRVLHGVVPVAADTDGGRVTGVRLEGAAEVVVTAPFVLDATETGELLPLTGTEHVTGAEAASVTGEPHAKPVAEPRNHQAFSVCFALDHRAREDHTIERPASYERWRGHFTWAAPDPRTNELVPRTFEPNPSEEEVDRHDLTRPGSDLDLWRFRRIAARATFLPGAYPSDITLVNWPQIDYTGGPLYPDGREHLAAARELSLSFLHWMQTEAGFPGLRPRGDVLGTADGLAMAPYVRESRRIAAEYTVVEQDLSLDIRGDRGAVAYPDTVGVGAYRIDLHPSTGGDGYVDIGACPYQIPLGALLPVRMDNLLPAAKNIGTTHITNGCYRLHPTEWNIGEASGLLAAFCLDRQVPPRAVRARPGLLEDFQALLRREEVELRWPDVRGY